MAGLKRRWPNREDLLTWWLWHKVQEAPIEQFDDVETFRIWLREFNHNKLIDTHMVLYEIYSDFRNEFVSTTDMQTYYLTKK